MPSRVKRITGHRRHPLTADWELCATEPDAYAGPTELTRAGLTWTRAHAPSTVAECLREAQLWSVDDPPRRFDARDWWYRARFAAPEHSEDTDVVLGFDGLATMAEAWLNGVSLLRSDNMFLAHERLLEKPLSPDNELLIRFRALDKLLQQRRPRPQWRAPMVENQQLRWFRTTLLGRTPGWSPPAAPVGPWRPVWIETRDNLRINQVSVHTSVAGQDGWLEVSADISGIRATITAVTLVASRGDESYSAHLQPCGASSYTGRVKIPEARLWWPHTHGEPALYDLSLTIDLGPVATRPCTTIDLGRTGFRTLTLDTRDGDFALRVNGVPVFCRGACWTPDPVTLRESPESLRRTLDQVRDAGMNMLRVGGTMVYESDDFLDLCDAYGILLWQDFMFANMSYPEEDAAFLASVDAEARQQLARLRARPCVAILCGNSEGEQQAAMWGAPRESWTTPLFNERLPALVREICPGVPFWPSSAHGGAFPHQGNVGTTSYYGVGAYLRPLEDARRAQIRFASECLAFANVPEPETLAAIPGGAMLRTHHPAWKARTPRDLGAGWDFDDVRDHYLTRLYGKDPLTLRYSDHERYLALSRVVSAEVMAATFAEWRCKRSTCRGALIWFWRDLWSGAGWGVVDALGMPKAAYHSLSRVLKPQALFLTDEGCNGLFVHMVNERAEPLRSTLEVTLYRQGEIVVSKAERVVNIPARETLELAAAQLFEGFLDLSYAYRFGPPGHDLVVAVLRGAAGETVAEAFHFDLQHQVAAPTDLGMTASAVARDDGGFDVRIATRRFAQSIWIEAEGFAAVENHFHLAPGSNKTVTVRSNAVGAKARGLRGRIHALNASAPAKIGT